MELGDLYQELILDHNASPRNYGRLDKATHCQEGHNPLCGDNLILYLNVDKGVIQDIRFVGEGCAISRASTSMMTTALKGSTLAEAEELFDAFHNLVTTGAREESSDARLGKLAALGGVRHFPARIKCATLPWHTLHAALHGETHRATTE